MAANADAVVAAYWSRSQPIASLIDEEVMVMVRSSEWYGGGGGSGSAMGHGLPWDALGWGDG